AVHPHLAFANDALNVTKRQSGKPRLEKTIEPHAALVRGHGGVLHAFSSIGCNFTHGFRPGSGPGDASSSERIRRNCGKRNIQSAATMKTPIPPSATAGAAPISDATAPARKSPR